MPLAMAPPLPSRERDEGEGAFFTRGQNVFEAQIVPRAGDELRAQPFLAFCGIGRPAKFFDTLRDAGISTVKCRAFPDHHPYTDADARALLGTAKTLKAGLITTAKDLARLRGALGVLAELCGATCALSPSRLSFRAAANRCCSRRSFRGFDGQRSSPLTDVSDPSRITPPVPVPVLSASAGGCGDFSGKLAEGRLAGRGCAAAITVPGSS